MELHELADKINDGHLRVLELEQSRQEVAKQVGDWLNEAKAKVKQDPKARWLPWLRENCPDLSERTAQQYMKFARGEVDNLDSGGRRKNESHSDFPDDDPDADYEPTAEERAEFERQQEESREENRRNAGPGPDFIAFHSDFIRTNLEQLLDVASDPLDEVAITRVNKTLDTFEQLISQIRTQINGA